MMAITTILFDVGGVLIEPLDQAAVQRRREGLAARLGFANASTMWQRFYTGPEWEATKTGRQSQAEMWQQLLSPHGLDTPAAQAAFVSELFDGEGVRPQMRRLLDELHGRHRLGIFSNAGDTLEAVLQSFGLDAYFDEIVNSHRIGLAKPDPRSFEMALSRLQAAPAEVFFTDNLARNVEAAAAMGITSHLFTTVAGLRAALHRHDLLSEDAR